MKLEKDKVYILRPADSYYAHDELMTWEDYLDEVFTIKPWTLARIAAALTCRNRLQKSGPSALSIDLDSGGPYVIRVGEENNQIVLQVTRSGRIIKIDFKSDRENNILSSVDIPHKAQVLITRKYDKFEDHLTQIKCRRYLNWHFDDILLTNLCLAECTQYTLDMMKNRDSQLTMLDFSVFARESWDLTFDLPGCDDESFTIYRVDDKNKEWLREKWKKSGDGDYMIDVLLPTGIYETFWTNTLSEAYSIVRDHVLEFVITRG